MLPIDEWGQNSALYRIINSASLSENRAVTARIPFISP